MTAATSLAIRQLGRWAVAQPSTWAGISLLRAWLRDWGGRLILGCTLHLAVYFLWYIFQWGGPEHNLLIADLAIPPVNLVAALLAWRAATHPALDRQTRRAWRIVSLAYLSYFIGNVLWFYYEVVLGTQAFPSWADAGFLPFYPLLLWGLLSFPMALRTTAERFKFWLDASIVLLGGGIVMWYFLVLPTTQAQSEPLAVLLSLAYVVMDFVLLLGIATILLRRPEEGSRQALRLLVGGLIFFFCADLGFAYLNLYGTFQGGDWPDWFWLCSVFLMAVSAQYQYWHASVPRPARPSPAAGGTRAFSVLPYLAVVGAYGLLLTVAHEQWIETLGNLVLGAVALTSLVMVRQLIAVRENGRLLAEAAARHSEARFRSLVQHSSDVIMVIDLSATIRYHTPSVARVLGYGPTELTGATITDLLHPDDAAPAQAALSDLLHQPGTSLPIEWRVRHQDSSWRHLETIGTNLRHDPDVGGIVLNMRDVTERKALEAQLTHLAFHDPLTKLANRHLFRERVKQACTRAPHATATQAVLFLDLDNFKTINDSLGHMAGDQVLVAVAEQLQTCVRAGDTVARFGGDEFAILVERLTHRVDAIQVAERVIEIFQAPIPVQETQVVMSASIGVVIGGDGQETPDDLLRNADIAMYAAKLQGKGCYRVFEPSMHAKVMERWQLEAELRQAIEQQQLAIHYQPIVDLQAGTITGVEALVRWQHPQRGIIAPSAFIPLAEETGLIIPLGSWVLQRACHQVRHWQTQYRSHPPLFVSINLSARQLQHPRLVDDVAQVLRQSQLEPQSLILEITESALMYDTGTAISQLQHLHKLGVRLAIDDFGTGYSSLNYLQQFPVTLLKIDKSFMDGVGIDSGKSTLTQAIITLSRMLKLQTVAEGIEVLEQWDVLRELGCHLGQGHYFARPGDAAVIGHLLRRRRLPAAGRARTTASAPPGIAPALPLPTPQPAPTQSRKRRTRPSTSTAPSQPQSDVVH